MKNKKDSNDIPDELAVSILSKLSMKSLYRFGCVRKSWTLLTKDPYFMGLFRKNLLCHNQSYYEDISLLLHQTMTINSIDKYVLYSLSGENFEKKTKLNWPNPFHEDDPEFDVVGSSSVNGILCLISDSQPNDRVVLWNPTTEEFKVIPTSHREYVPYVDVEITRYGFGFDFIRDDYKVIRQVMYNPNSSDSTDSDIDDLSLENISYNLFWEIYSLRSNSWRKLDFPVPHNYRDDVVYLDGVCHWLGEEGYDGENDDEVYLLSFDLCNELFLITPIPPEDEYSDFSSVWKDFVVLNGSLALITPCAKYNTFHISILGELGVKESWTKLYIVCSLPCVERPLNVEKKRYIFSILNFGRPVCFDLNTLMVEMLDFVGDIYWGKTIIYKESSLLIGGVNQ